MIKPLGKSLVSAAASSASPPLSRWTTRASAAPPAPSSGHPAAGERRIRRGPGPDGSRLLGDRICADAGPVPPGPLHPVVGAILLVLALAGCQNDDTISEERGIDLQKSLSPVIAGVVEESRATERYASYHPERGTYYRAIPGFLWRASLAEARFGTASSASYRYSGFAMQVETPGNALDPAQICSGSVRIALYPPAATLTASGARFDSENGMGNEASSWRGGVCGNDYFQLRALDDDGDGMWDRFRYSFPPSSGRVALLNSAVPGSWQLREGTGVLASFELPELDPEDIARLPRPVPHLNYDDATGLLESIDIQWYLADGLEPVDNSEMVKKSVVALLDLGTDGELGEQYEAYGLPREAVFPDHPWRLKDHVQTREEDPRIVAIQFSYEIEGVAYRYVWQD